MLSTDPALPGDAKALATLLRSLAGKPPANPHVDNGPWDFLGRADAAVQESRVRPVLLELLTDREPVVREHAIGALMRMPPQPKTFDRLIEIAEKHTKLLEAEAFGEPIARRMEHALSNLAQDAAQRRRAAKAMVALTRDRLPLQGPFVAQYEPAHLIALARRHGAVESAGYWAAVADRVAVYQRDQLLPLLDALASLDAETRAAVASAVEGALAVDDKTAAEFAKVEGLPPPKKPGPSADDCKQALGVA